MCRWLAYSGAPIYLDEVLFKPEHSLIDQSLHSRQSVTTTNGDGFGLGWYSNREEPGVYKEIQPAWNDSNLRALAGHIESPLFLAHVRAATGTAVQRSNCHPFQYRNWLFVHNGNINGFHAIKRDLVLAISPEFFAEINGTTDSEIMFYLALTFGMAEDVAAGVARMVGFIEQVGRRHGIDDPVQMSLGISDGSSLCGFRYSTGRDSRTLYHSESMAAVQQIAPGTAHFSADARAIVSEPLSDLEGAWIPVEESSVITVLGGDVQRRNFVPELP